MKTLKNLNISKIKKIIIPILLFIIVLYLSVFLYSYIYEKDKLLIDRYNFEQLEKVRYVLDKLDKNTYQFNNIKEFNKKFNQNIKPIKNCYILADRNGFFNNNNGGGGYVFGFKLESLFYKKIYKSNDYIYPKYDLPSSTTCVGGVSVGGSGLGGGGCFDLNYKYFIETI